MAEIDESGRRKRNDHAVIDGQVGANIRRRRLMLGLTQSDLAAELNLTFQQVQKYERGSSRVSASTIWRIASALHCSPNDLFEGVELASGRGETADAALAHVLTTPVGMAMLKSFAAAPEGLRPALVAVARALTHHGAILSGDMLNDLSILPAAKPVADGYGVRKGRSRRQARPERRRRYPK